MGGVGVGVGVKFHVDFSKPEWESESESLKSGRLRSTEQDAYAITPRSSHNEKRLQLHPWPKRDTMDMPGGVFRPMTVQFKVWRRIEAILSIRHAPRSKEDTGSMIQDLDGSWILG